ncbi:hemolysin XhlA family protein [Brevibacillus ruminantium]|uniref:Hemolysin XhlA family protein n=1 Tax=Brevibacillus ruminantium TaxID=2950604 RepID=A0ABY4WCP1_9BACL|nr:hemolysin XhlA family protein [Brevibacillus ruminantium]USG64935.1 hemolysin XhlA family protein [Brevibacillus ruminantium]
MTPEQPEIWEPLRQMNRRLDNFEERIDKLEVQMSVATKWLERIEHRLERMEEARAELLKAMTKLQTELELKRGTTDKEIILQMLDNDKHDREKLTHLIAGDKGRKQERFLQIWAVLGPVIASVLSSLFTKYFL